MKYKGKSYLERHTRGISFDTDALLFAIVMFETLDRAAVPFWTMAVARISTIGM